MTRNKTALITGITGQDGSYLLEFLLAKGYKVFGLVRRSSRDPFSRIPENIRKQATFLYGDLRDIGALERALAVSRPDEIYNLAAQSDVGVSFLCPEETFEIDYLGVGRLVNAARDIVPKARIYPASTSEMFGTAKPPQYEKTPFQPVSPYGMAKRRAHEDFVEAYRTRHGMFICSGILFNHESPRRGEHFVTRKITISLAKIQLGLQDSFELGNLNSKRDWGFAGDYVEPMWKMLQQPTPEDFVIGSGETRSVRDFVLAAARSIGMKITFEGRGLREVGKDERGKVVIRVNKKFYRPHEVEHLRADISKAHTVLGWRPKTSFAELVAMMTEHDLTRLSDTE